MRCFLGHDIVETAKERRLIPWYEFVIVFTLLLSIFGIPILYFICVHTNFANDWFINGICTRCDKVWFDCDEYEKTAERRREFERTKRDRFNKLANLRKKALGE